MLPTDAGNLVTIKKHGKGNTKYYAVYIASPVIKYEKAKLLQGWGWVEEKEYFFRNYTSAFAYRKDGVTSLTSQIKHNSPELRLSAPMSEVSNKSEYNADNFRGI